ncbi:MAG: cytochrome c [Filomicrobium sp.]
MLRTLCLALGVLAATIPVAQAQNLEVIKMRKDLLEAMGKAAKSPGKMMKQEIPFDKAVVEAALDTFIKNAPKLPDLFPDDSKTGGKTNALPAIWDNKKDVADRFAKLIADAKAAKGTVNDEFEFMETWPKVVGNCGSCHKKYKKKDE